MEPLKKRFVIGLSGVFISLMLITTGCSSSKDKIKNLSNQSSSSLKCKNSSLLKENEKLTNDSELLNVEQNDSTDNMDSLEIQIPQQQLSSEEIDTLLKDDSGLTGIPDKINLK